MKILFIHSDPDKSEFYNDYLSDLLLNGLRENYGKDVIDYPGSWYLYNDEVKNRDIEYNKLWGKGFTLNNSLKVICDACSKSSNNPRCIFASVSRAYLIASSLLIKVLEIVR